MLDRKKTPSLKRENNFNKTADPKQAAIMKFKVSNEEAEKFRKATLSPQQSQSSNSKPVTK
jgi:hypothetical protein